MAYTPAVGEPRSRVRLLVGDTSTTAPAFTDDELDTLMESTWEWDFLKVYQRDAAATAATLEILVESSTYKLKLSRTMPGPTVEADEFALRGDQATDRLGKLLAAADALGRGWEFQLHLGAGLRWGPWNRAGLRTARSRRALQAASWDLAPTGSALDVLGAAKAKTLARYRVNLAAADALDILAASPGKFKTYTIGKVSITLGDLKDRAQRLRGPTVIGAPAGVIPG